MDALTRRTASGGDRRPTGRHCRAARAGRRPLGHGTCAPDASTDAFPRPDLRRCASRGRTTDTPPVGPGLLGKAPLGSERPSAVLPRPAPGPGHTWPACRSSGPTPRSPLRAAADRAAPPG
ncbi:hypothetical protein KCH_00290 [Kitasatospora cheerisanensis KCTC 2395]|uniref:Uncharacterized protein n=1 Tax=Kitasatospora cheerisanensis KCTC 2395 TaxID=1348663 RepID=A0A066Z7I9_9ACTN|nr:hypothetical protein KCH_00290 [Kitasatospora cheerisanensis KCTC 2395]